MVGIADVDRVEVKARRLQRFITFLFILSIITVVFNVWTMISLGVVVPGIFIMLAINWIVLYTGYIGAKQRRTGLLMFYTLVNAFFSIILIASYFGLSVGSSVYIVGKNNACAHDDSCPEHDKAVSISHKYPSIIGTIFAVGIFAIFVPVIVHTVACGLAFALRCEIIRAQRIANLFAKMEEGACQAAKKSKKSTGKTVPQPAQVPLEMQQYPAFMVAPEGQQQQQQQQQQPQYFYAPNGFSAPQNMYGNNNNIMSPYAMYYAVPMNPPMEQFTSTAEQN